MKTICPERTFQSYIWICSMHHLVFWRNETRMCVDRMKRNEKYDTSYALTLLSLLKTIKIKPANNEKLLRTCISNSSSSSSRKRKTRRTGNQKCQTDYSIIHKQIEQTSKRERSRHRNQKKINSGAHWERVHKRITLTMLLLLFFSRMFLLDSNEMKRSAWLLNVIFFFPCCLFRPMRIKLEKAFKREQERDCYV